MTVQELRGLLEHFPEDMVVAHRWQYGLFVPLTVHDLKIATDAGVVNVDNHALVNSV